MKKISILKIAISLFGLLFMLGCRKVPEYKLLFKSIDVLKQAHLTTDSLSPTCSVCIELNYVDGTDSVCNNINMDIIRAVFEYNALSPKMAVDSFVSHYINSYTHDMLPYYMEDKEVGKGLKGWYNYYYNLKTDIQEGRERILNYIIEKNCYEGGAHGSQINTYLNFYLENGKLITLDDVFLPGYESLLNDILLKKLMQQIEVTSMEDLQEKGYLLWTEMYPSKNFLLKSDYIEFLYNAYEIAPYALGVTVLRIPYEEMQNILKK